MESLQRTANLLVTHALMLKTHPKWSLLFRPTGTPCYENDALCW